MTGRKPLLVAALASLVVAAMTVAVAFAFVESNHQRRASCRATLIALDATGTTAAAGIRPVPSSLLDPDDRLTPLFEQQRRATRAENARRRAVIARTTKAADDLRKSDFCR